jgi:hypothetical protein
MRKNNIRTEYAILVDGFDTGLTPKTLEECRYQIARLKQKGEKGPIEIVVGFYRQDGRPTGYLRLIKGGKAA